MRPTRLWPLGALALLGAGCAPLRVGPGVSLPPGRAAQAGGGRQLALSQCAGCHGAALEGRYGPALSGPRFQAAWRSRTAADLRDFIAASMPLGRGGTLTDPQTLELVTYLLSANGLPGDGPALTPDGLTGMTLFSP